MDYWRDGVGTPLEVRFSGSAYLDSSNVIRYGYDSAGRLDMRDWGYYDEGWTSYNRDDWEYDWVGNRNPNDYSYNQVDEADKDVYAMYDMLGNLTHVPSDTASDRTDYTYSDDNLLKQINCVSGGASNTTEMTWDADQQRLKITKGANTWEMVYDAVAGIPAVLLGKNYVNSTTSYVYYVRTPGGELLTSFDAEGSNVRYYHFDALGSTVLASNGSSATTASVSYDAWGEPWSVYGTSTAPYRYVGELGYYSHTSSQGGDALTNLLQLGLRFYDPQLGRFTQRDPEGYRGGLNVYSYCTGNPAALVDPLGLWPGMRPIPVPPAKKDGGCANLAKRLLGAADPCWDEECKLMCTECCYELQLYLRKHIDYASAGVWAKRCTSKCHRGLYLPWDDLPRKWYWW